MMMTVTREELFFFLFFLSFLSASSSSSFHLFLFLFYFCEFFAGKKTPTKKKTSSGKKRRETTVTTKVLMTPSKRQDEEGKRGDDDDDVDLLGEIAVSANNQGTSIPRKRDYRQRAHCNPLANGRWEDTPTAPDAFREDGHYERTFLEELKKDEGKEAKITFADIGCGFGGLLVRLSPLFPKELIMGMEIRAQVSEYVRERSLALRKEHPGEYQNISGLRTNSMKFLPNYFEKGQLKKIFFLFPDPHFKRSKRRRRIIQTALIAEYAFCLREGGILYTQTDVKDVGDWMKEKLDMSPLFRPMTEGELNEDVCVELLRRGTPTEEGQKVKRNSGSTWLHCYVRVHGNPRY